MLFFTFARGFTHRHVLIKRRLRNSQGLDNRFYFQLRIIHHRSRLLDLLFVQRRSASAFASARELPLVRLSCVRESILFHSRSFSDVLFLSRKRDVFRVVV